MVVVNAQSNNGNTALHLAGGNAFFYCERSVEMVEMFLDTLKLEDVDKRVRLDLKNDKGQTPIELARDKKLDYDKNVQPWHRPTNRDIVAMKKVISMLEKCYQYYN